MRWMMALIPFARSREGQFRRQDSFDRYLEHRWRPRSHGFFSGYILCACFITPCRSGMYIHIYIYI